MLFLAVKAFNRGRAAEGGVRFQILGRNRMIMPVEGIVGSSVLNGDDKVFLQFFLNLLQGHNLGLAFDEKCKIRQYS